MRLALAILLSLTGVAFAEDATVQAQPSCWLNGKSFSPGATIRAGDSVMICSQTFAWEKTTSDAAGCLLRGDLFGINVVAIEQDRATKNKCQPDGTWVTIEPGK
ncbi:DUF1496 domain-containing protein [Mesorhizobium sp.]|uniref:DUF1496 domain-containing protein n=1 Tax=Mesorhizobium sp. TaxID=1871066 RepID=UPI000FE7F50D|nr:MAG: DUF1496 domain-containing protein [Mesorhizobium sp.]